MSGYRLFLMDQDGHITERIDLDCDNEDEAREIADEGAHEIHMELWCLGRALKVYPGRFRRAGKG